MKPICTEAEILAYLQANTGQRFSATAIASHFDVGSRSMFVSLDNLLMQGRVTKTERGQHSAMWSAKAAAAPIVQPQVITCRPFREWQPDPVLLARYDEARAHRQRFPSRFD